MNRIFLPFLRQSRACSTKVSIESFESCQEYLRHKFRVDRPYSKHEWDGIMTDIVDTLPAYEVIPLEEVASSTSRKQRKNAVRTQKNLLSSRGRTPVKPYFSDSFILSMCCESQVPESALSFVEFMKSENKDLTVVHKSLLLKLLSRVPMGKFDTEISEVCEDIYDDFRKGILPEDAEKSFIGALARTDRWKEAVDLVDELSGKDFDGSSGLNQASTSLILRSMAEGDDELTWSLMESPNFHCHLYPMRDRGTETLLMNMDNVFIKWIEKCRRLKESNQWERALDRVEKLFEYIKNFKLHLRESVKTELENLFEGTDYDVTQTSLNRSGMCQSCKELQNPKMTDDDSDVLWSAILDKVILKSDIYQSTNPKEIGKFRKFLDSSADYDVVIDGLNVSLSRVPGIKRKTDVHQSETLLDAVSNLEASGLRSLIIHRHVIKKFPHFRDLHDMSQIYMVDRVSQDDPFMVLAALHRGPGCFILTNDVLRQHCYALQDPVLRKLFTRWQLLHQIRHEGWRRKRSVGVDLMFPANHVPEAFCANTKWHLPMALKTVPECEERIHLEVPKHWLCIARK